MARDEAFEDERGMDRRTFMKAAVGIGALGLTGSLVASGKSLIPNAVVQAGTVNEGFVYAKGDTPNPFGFDQYVGQNAQVSHFTQDWAGVAAVWRAVFDADNKQIPGTGFPVLLLKVDTDLYRYPTQPATPSDPAPWIPGEDFIDDSGIIAIWDRCVHLCCFPGWHLTKLPPSYQQYDASRVPRTLSAAGEDPIWCRCHNSQYDPITVVWDVHPNGTVYMGANMAHGPAKRALAVVSVTNEGGKITGKKFLDKAPDPPASVVAALGGKPGGRIYRDWYFAYCR
ncbi:MAG: hypothetical protein E6K18_00765 [Methanobacteriota archaeon]|nr:MAG: hypothetical protein E6K18_00765 [Euryarchaeota archaeon]